MGQDVPRILYIATEPWEILFASTVAGRMKQQQSESVIRLAIADTFTLNYAHSLVRNLEEFSDTFDFCSLKEDFQSWQELKKPSPDYKYMVDWMARIEPVRTAEELQKTHQGLHGYENERYYLPLSLKWKDHIFIDHVKWMQHVIDEFRPTKIFTMERRSAAANIAWEISKSLEIPMATLVKSRVGDRWIFRNDFGYGTSAKTRKEINECFVKDAENEEVQTLIRGLKENGYLYSSPTRRSASELAHWLARPHKSFFAECLRETKRGITRLLVERKQRAFRTVRADQSFFRLTLWQFARATRLWRWARLDKPSLVTDTPEGRYFLWCLQVRPEDSVSVLGDGRNEMQEIMKVVHALPPGCKLVVKENAQMLGLRKPGFYQELQGSKLICLASPLLHSQPLIEESLGVIGISGTVLLEAALIEKPTCVLGSADFAGDWAYQGWDCAAKFMEDVVRGQAKSTTHSARAYLTFVLSQKPVINFQFEAPLDECHELTRQIAEHLLHTSG